MREVFKRLISLALIFLIVFMPYTKVINLIDVEVFKVSASATCGPDDYVMAKDSDFRGESNGEFRYIGNDECVEIPHVIKGVSVINYHRMFSEFYGANSSTIKGVKSTNKNITDASYMFYLSQAKELDLSNFDAKNLTNTYAMFENAQATKGLARTKSDADKFNDSPGKPSGLIFEEKYKLATDEDFKFEHYRTGTCNRTSLLVGMYKNKDGCFGNFVYIGQGEFVEIPHKIQGVDMTSYYRMFSDSNGAESSTIKGVISTNKNVTNMTHMFRDSQATSLDLSSFDTSNVTNMIYMFYNSQATSLNLSSFDTSKVTDMRYMFYNSRATSLDLSSFDTSNVTDMGNMFRDSSATELDLSSFDTSNVTDMSYMFLGSQATSLDLSRFDTSKVTNMSNMFQGSRATSLDLSKFDTSKVTDMGNMFRNSQATTLDLSSFNTSNVTNMRYMFCDSRATSLDLSKFDTSNVTNMSDMFYNSQADSLDLSSFDTSNVTNMSNMFRGSSATELDLSRFDTSNVTNMSYMFYNSRATSLDLSRFDTSKVTNMTSMFRNSSATELDLSSFDTSNVANMSGMFRDSQATKGYARTQADTDKLNGSSNKPDPLNFVIIGTPVISFSENGNSTYKKSQTTKVDVDWSKSEKESLAYQWTNSSTFPSGGTWISFSSGNTITKQNGTGDFYLHIKAKSQQGIEKEVSSNAFKLDNQAPKIENLNSGVYEFEFNESQKKISFNVGDQHSGLDKIEYTLTDESKNQTIGLTDQNQKFSSNQKSAEVSVSLPSEISAGEYTLGIKVYDNLKNVATKNVTVIINGTLELTINGDVQNENINFGDITLNGEDTQESDKKSLSFNISDTRRDPGWTLQIGYNGFGNQDPGFELLMYRSEASTPEIINNQTQTITSNNSAESVIQRDLSIRIPKTTLVGEYETEITITLIGGTID